MNRNRHATPSATTRPLSSRTSRIPGELYFAVIQAGVEEVRNEIHAELAEQFNISLVLDQRTTKILSSVLSEIEREGVKAVTRLRRLRGDGVALGDWRDVARRTMITKLVSCFEDAQAAFDDERDDDGCASPGPKADPKPGPVGGAALALPISARPRLLAHSDYLATDEDVARAVLPLAMNQARRQVGAWSTDSERLDDFAAEAATRVLSSYQRLWDPSKSSLLAYLGVSVRYAVHDEYVAACKRKRNGGLLIEAAECQLREDLRTRPDVAEQDPRAVSLRDELATKHAMEWLRPYIGCLNDHQRREIERRLCEGHPGTPAQQLVYSRAVRRLRLMVA